MYNIRSVGVEIKWGMSSIQLSGITGEFGDLFSKNGLRVFLGFGLPTAIGLFAGPFGDQCFWQRAFSISDKKIGRAFSLGAVLFAVVPLSMGILDLLRRIGFMPKDTGMVNFELIQALFPMGNCTVYVHAHIRIVIHRGQQSVCDCFTDNGPESYRQIKRCR